MTELVSSVQRVTDIMGEISSANHEQEAGIAQINLAVTDRDAVTQQNAALVEEAAAAAASLQDQAVQLAAAVSVFKLAEMQAAPVKRPRQPQPQLQPQPELRARPAVKPAPRLAATAGADADDWEQF
jgi:methyl-accepting chemotaxis protein